MLSAARRLQAWLSPLASHITKAQELPCRGSAAALVVSQILLRICERMTSVLPLNMRCVLPYTSRKRQDQVGGHCWDVSWAGQQLVSACSSTMLRPVFCR